jgi:tetratricopeptide (TPR) repeat protein
MPEKDTHGVSRQASEYYEKALAAVQRNKLDPAIDFLQSALRNDPSFLKARQLLRATQIKKFKTGGGGGMFGKLMGSVAGAPALASAMANVKKDPTKAMDAAEQALSSNPFNVQALSLLAEAALAMNDTATAVFAYETARDGSPDNTDVLMKLGAAYLASNQHEKARDCFDRVCKLDPNNSEAYQAAKDATTQAAMKKGNWETATSYKDLIKDKDEAHSLERAAKIFKDEDVLRSQMEDVYKQAQAQPDNISLWRKLGDLAVQANEFDYAIQNYLHAYELTNRSDMALKQLAAGAENKKTNFLIQQKEEQLKADPNNQDLQQEVAALRQVREKMLLEECEARSQRYPNDLDIRYELGTLYYRNGMVDKAIGEFQLAVNNPRTKIQCVNWLGKCFRDKGLLDMAAQRFKSAADECIMMDGLKKEILYNLGSTFEQMGKEEEAIEQYKQLYDVDVNFRDVGQKIETYYKKRSQK